MSTKGAAARDTEQPGQPAAPGVTPERIRARAYEIFLARKGGDGDALADWLQAERELKATPRAGDGRAQTQRRRS